MSATLELIEVPLARDQLADRWQALCVDPTFEDIAAKIELTEWGEILMSPVGKSHGIAAMRIAELLHKALGGHTMADEALTRRPSGLLGRAREAALAENRVGFLEVALGFLECRLTVHHARARLVAEFLDLCCTNRHGESRRKKNAGPCTSGRRRLGTVETPRSLDRPKYLANESSCASARRPPRGAGQT